MTTIQNLNNTHQTWLNFLQTTVWVYKRHGKEWLLEERVLLAKLYHKPARPISICAEEMELASLVTQPSDCLGFLGDHPNGIRSGF